MSREFGGHSSLGAHLNRVGSKLDHIDVSRFKNARAVLKESHKGLYVFFMDLLDGAGQVVGKTGPIPIIGTEDQLSQLYGTPSNMTGGDQERWEAIVFYQGTTVNNGVALVTRRLQELEGGKFEAVSVANELVAKGAAYAPPGSGMM